MLVVFSAQIERRVVHDLLAGLRSPAEDQNAKDQPRHPGADNFASGMTVVGAMLSLRLLAFQGMNSLGVPDHEEADEAHHRHHGGDHVHQIRTVKVGNRKLGDRE